ncbi:MAG: HAD family phosphatase, partial [Lachnospiraceae bacterium]|nr:HAD family phosphatase [Lachnospiraceae bacterium]
MNKKKYVFVDLDGTLLTDEKTVCQRNAEAIAKAIEQGHHVITATGRPLESAIIGAKNAGLHKPGCYILAYNGGLIYECATDNILHEETLSMSVVEAMF